MRVRRIAATESEELRRLRLDTLLDAPEAFVMSLDELTAKSPAYWAEAARLGATSGRRAAFVAEDEDGRWIGGASVVVGDEGAEVQAMWVRPAARGDDVSTALLAVAFDWCREHGEARAIAWIRESNEPALLLATRLGFRSTGATRRRSSSAADIHVERSLAEP